METLRTDVIKCFGAYQDSKDYSLCEPLDVSFSQNWGLKRVGCTFMDPNGFCLAYRKPDHIKKILACIVAPFELWKQTVTPNGIHGPTALEELELSKPVLKKCPHLFPTTNAKH